MSLEECSRSTLRTFSNGRNDSEWPKRLQMASRSFGAVVGTRGRSATPDVDSHSRPFHGEGHFVLKAISRLACDVCMLSNARVHACARRETRRQKSEGNHDHRFHLSVGMDISFHAIFPFAMHPAALCDALLRFIPLPFGDASRCPFVMHPVALL